METLGYNDLKLIKRSEFEEVYISAYSNVIIKLFYYTEEDYYNTQKICALSIKFSNLISDYVPMIYYIYETNKYIALIMENIENVNFNTYINNKENVNYNITNIIIIINSLLRAIFAMHKLGYVHNDLHGQNILITKDYSIKLIDFSLCENVNSVGDRFALYIEDDYISIRYYVSHLIYPNLPLSNISDTIKITKSYTEQDVISYDTNPIKAKYLYDLLQLI